MENLQTANQPTEKIVKGPKALFWFLTLFFTLEITAFSTGGLWFQYINKFFPLEVSNGQITQAFSQTALKWQMSSLIVAVPVFFLISWLIRKALNNGTLLPGNKVRLWITYIILFIVLAITVGDLITTTFYGLNGDFTARFCLKSLTILIIASWIFTYYWLEIRADHSLIKSKLPKIFGIISIVVIIISFVGAFFVIESPKTARNKAYDSTRSQDLTNIKYAIDNYYSEYKKLPDNLSDLKENNAYLKLNDPESKTPYEYKITDETSYELCAEFEYSNKDTSNQESYLYGTEFSHDAGYNCFDRKISNYLIKDKENSDATTPQVPAEPIYID